MSIANYKRLTVALTIVIVLLVIRLLGFYYHEAKEQARVFDIYHDVRSFDMMRDEAVRSEPNDAVRILDELSKIRREDTTPEDALYNYERTNAMQDIVVYLRKKTGDDFGDAPKGWIDKYGK